MGDEQDLPIALRRTPRASVGAAGASNPTRMQADSARSTNSRTPSKPRSKKRVRFSDPGPEIQHHDASSSTTGLTPMVRRTSLGYVPSPKRRRQSAPQRRRSYPEREESEISNSNENNEVHFLSLRQVLDERVKRRIRRNGLSEEMNNIDKEKRQRVQEQNVELQRLKDELAAKDQEIDRLQNATTVQDTDRIIELEQQIEALRNDLQNKSRSGPEVERTRNYDWTMDPFSDDYMDVDEDFGETTMADLICSTPSRKARNPSASFPTPPCTSPPLPSTPHSMRRGTPVTPQSHHSHSGVQAALPDPEKEALEAELGSLRLELTKLTEVLQSHEALKTRIADQLAKASSSSDDDDGETPKDVEERLETVLQSLSDRTAALSELNSSLSSLGFPGSDASEMVTSITTAFRSARLELEYLTPGEITLPLSSRNAQVLDLVLAKLRELARRVHESDAAVDEYHALELSLRQQLGARVDAMDRMRREQDKNRTATAEKDERVADLEVGVERLKGAAEGYRRDVADLETLVQRLEAESKVVSAEAAGAQAELAHSRAAAAKLEAQLASVKEQADAFQRQLSELQKRRASEVKALNKYHGMALSVRDARVLELRRGMDEMTRNLHEAHSTIQQLRVENLGLGRRADDEERRAKDAVDSIKAELERVIGMSVAFLATPSKASSSASGKRSRDSGSQTTTPEGSPMRPEEYLAGGLAKTVKSVKSIKKRKYDSGLGFLDEDEDGPVDLV
ncbi:hypothetical protein M426DRAFT_65530 [Hypoxylon sp. CI-4A]|nr:hypothetical protein M426DRAFT_65530 [Hypoxylon sp. CI-4A]